MSNSSEPPTTHEPPSDPMQVDIPGVGSFHRSQLTELWDAIGEGAAWEDQGAALPDLTQMSIEQLRQFQRFLDTMPDLRGVSPLPNTVRQHLQLLPMWCINEAAFRQLTPARRPAQRGLECAICCQSLDADPSVSLPCASVGCASLFHTGCIRPWLQRRPNCPLCRADLMELVVQEASSCDDCSRNTAVTNRASSIALNSARVFAALCHIQAVQTSKQVVPCSGSVVVGLFNREGSRVIPRGDLLSWLREQDWLLDGPLPSAGSSNLHSRHPSHASMVTALAAPMVSLASTAGASDRRGHRRPLSAAGSRRQTETSGGNIGRSSQLKMAMTSAARGSTLLPAQGKRSCVLRPCHSIQRLHTSPQQTLPKTFAAAATATHATRASPSLGRSTSFPSLARSHRSSPQHSRQPPQDTF